MYDYKSTLVKVVDGDTVDLLLDRGFFDSSQKRFRLARVNTPEKGQSGWQEATDFVVAWFAGVEYVIVRSFKGDTKIPTDKYGRFVAVITKPGAIDSLNDSLLAAGLAVPY